jgi:hypothetical protein
VRNVSGTTADDKLEKGDPLGARGIPDRSIGRRIAATKSFWVDKRGPPLGEDLARGLALPCACGLAIPPSPEFGALARCAQPSGRARVGRPRLPAWGAPLISLQSPGMPAWAAFVGHTFPLETPVELSSQWIGNREELREIAVGQQSCGNRKRAGRHA